MRSELIHKIFSVGKYLPDSLVLEVFRYQYDQNPLYRQFCSAIHRPPEKVINITDIPFLPIRFFKTHAVKTGDFEPETFFESSGTTGTINSRHLVRSLDIYRESFTRGFEIFYGMPQDLCIIGLLPAYLERQHSSLVFMVDELIRLSGHPQSGFYLYDHDKLSETLLSLEKNGQRAILIGVTFALLDFADKFPINLHHTIIMETGGMKGRRKELTRPELHQKLSNSFGEAQIHSEYGMTELLSQAYSADNGIFYSPPWLKILFREEDDPLVVVSPGGHYPPGDTRRVKNGAINVIDLANIDSCCFIATDDMGRMHPDGGFEVLGRIDNSDIRGCSLMTI
ncbi:LuxE/PaaK family acyltransferase [Flavihumibacter profundi]|uniref:LuxE/PaaK family acyltransferase n=1 Tax=Flavihumibacter profundi TaxID=2716883 RepID=UPI001CC6AE78|nr:acyl transferase [Flavihumibacter profundi]MBZ5856687.1 acyl transferase [Flavihumibacter profundi]